MTMAMNSPLPGTHVRWEDLPVERLADGIERQMVVGQQLMICRLRFRPHVDTPVHSHPHEQITIVERGRVRFHVDGTDRMVSAGDILHFPSNVRHGATNGHCCAALASLPNEATNVRCAACAGAPIAVRSAATVRRVLVCIVIGRSLCCARLR